VIPPFAAYLFDVDGTLVDSAADIYGAVHEALSSIPHNGISEAIVRRYIGRSLADTFRDLAPGSNPEIIEALIGAYRAAYREREHRLTRLFPGVRETLGRLAGRKATATTKSTATTQIVLRKFSLLEYFDHVQGSDGFPNKPAPDVIFASLSALSVGCDDCLLVGDSAADMEAGRRAGVKICAVRYGYGDAEELARWKPDYWISDLRELIS
jgi:phosphoglycolate phosphatase